MEDNELTKLIVDAAYRVHVSLGPGLLESVYETCLEHEFKSLSLYVERQVPINISYNELLIKDAFKADLIINQKIIVELK